MSDVSQVEAQIAQELANPTGSRALAVTVDVGDLSTPGALDELRAGAQSLIAQTPAGK